MIKMILKRLIKITLIIFCTYSTVNASETDSLKNTKGISIGYWGPLFGYWGPSDNSLGLRLGLENYYLQTEKYNVIGRASIVFQRKPDTYTSSGLILSSALQRTLTWGLYIEQSFKLGYIGSYYDFDFYKTNSDGEVINIGRKWQSSMIVGFSVGLGYDFSKKTKYNLKIFINPTLYYTYPNNENIFMLNNYSFDIGLIFQPKWLNKKE